MSDEASLDELLSLWQQEHARGHDLPAAVVCRDRPELAAELERRIEAVRRMNALARAGSATRIAASADGPVSPPAIVSPASLMEDLRRHRLLDAAQLEELEAHAARFPDAKALAGDLIRRGWLTPYQANQLLQRRGRELVLGSYVILERLGEGGMGTVFKAWNSRLAPVVALKVIRRERLADPEAVRRFRREVQAAAAVSHPNVVHAYDADEIGGTHLLVMECVEGATDLARLVGKRGPLPVARACEFIRQAALGLQHAYERGLVHRDIKPSNLLLTATGRWVKVLDMGLARLARAGGDGDRSSTMTQEGAIMGTPDYIAPEQVMGSHGVDIRADLYSLGCTFYHLLAGRVPFPDGTLMQKLDGHRFSEPARVETLRPDVPPAVAAVVRKLMAKRPEDRYQTPAEVAAALASLLRPEGETASALGVADRTVVDGGRAAVVAKTLADTVASPFADLEAEATEVVVAPKGLRGVARRRWLLLAGGCGCLAVAGVVALPFVLLHRAAENSGEKQAGDPAGVATQVQKAPRKVDDAWLKQVAALPAERQVKAVVAKLKELNPGFDGKETHNVENGVVIQLYFVSDSVTDISPVQALASLKGMGCGGSTYGSGKLADLSPLKDLKLTHLNCGSTQVADLSPLKGMPLTALVCDFKPERDSEILRSVTTLATINDKPAGEFWKDVETEKP